MRSIAEKLLKNCGGTSLKTLFIFIVMMTVLAFLVQVFMLYSACSTVKTAVERSVMSVASVNKPVVFSSLREGNTYTETPEVFITAQEIRDNLISELGLVDNGDSLDKLGAAGNTYYRIKNISVTAANTDSKSYNTSLCFITEFKLEISFSQYWSFGAVEIPMRVESSYKAKY